MATEYPISKKGKEWLYVGYYIDTQDRFILKIGTTNDLARRKTEHNYNYRKSSDFTLPKTASFEYVWFIPLSKYNTLRFEDKNKEAWQAANLGQYIRNDRFYCAERPTAVQVKIRKTYEIDLTNIT